MRRLGATSSIHTDILLVLRSIGVDRAGSEQPSVTLLSLVSNLRLEHNHDVLELIQFRQFFLFRLTQQTCLIERKQPLQPALRPI